MKKIALIVIAVGAILFAKKRFIDPPHVAEPSKAEVIAERVGRIQRAKMEGRLPDPKDLKIVETATAGLPAATGSVDANALAGILSQLQKQQASPQDAARARVETFMAAWKAGGTSLNDEAQAAACLWSRGMRFIPDRDEIQDAATGFDKFRWEKNLYTDIKQYEVMPSSGYKRNDAAHGDFTVVDVTINYAIYHLGVPDKANPIFWTF
jgi:hypothetical protein